MNFKKRYAESLVFNGEMVVMGGYNQNQGWLNFVEKRNADGSFTEMTDWQMPRQIFDFCAVDMGNNKIMVLGNYGLSWFYYQLMAILVIYTIAAIKSKLDHLLNLS